MLDDEGHDGVQPVPARVQVVQPDDDSVAPEPPDGVRHPLVRRVGPLLSMYIGPDEVLLTLDVEFDPGASAAEVAAAVRKLEGEIRGRFEKITRIYIEARTFGAQA